MSLSLRPVDLATCKRFVGRHHRHCRAPVGWKFGVGLEKDGDLVGVAIAGRPTARGLDQVLDIEITRTCTLGDRNANSRLYGAICRAATALGYRSAYTYTLDGESGASLRAAGFVQDGTVDAGRTWDCKARQRTQTDLIGDDVRPIGAKVRWKRKLRTAEECDE